MRKIVFDRLKNVSLLTLVFFMAAVLACVIAAVHGVQSDWMLATFTPCLGSLADNITQDCDNPRVSGYETTALIINRDDIDWSSITVDSSNPRIVKTLALNSGTGIKPYVIYNPRVNPASFNGTKTEYSSDNDRYTKTLQFYFEGIGGGASKDVVEPLKSGSYLVILQRKDHRGDGSFQIIGYQSGLVASDEVQDEDTGYWLITMNTTEPSAEIAFFNTDYATTKAAFDTLLAQA